MRSCRANDARSRSIETCQTPARHSSPVLTIGIYAKASLHDIAGVVESLPDLTPTQPHCEALSATETEGGPLATATQSATPTIVDGTQSHKLQMVSAIHAQDLGSCPVRGEGSNPSSRSVEADEAPAEFWLTDDRPALR